MNQPWYIGSGSYCYANSTAMLLASIGEDISPATIEVLTGVGLSASAKREDGVLFFNYQPLLPDLGIQKALDLLGFECQVHVSENESNYPASELREALKTSAAIIGPVDMGYLPYNPHNRVVHADHYVFAYQADEDCVYLHDPAGFPHVFSTYGDLRKAWKAELIDYRQGYYRFVSHARRVKRPSADEIYQTTLAHFSELYRLGNDPKTRESWAIGKEAIDQLADRIQTTTVSDAEKGHLLYFALPLGAKRANDFALFFKDRNRTLCELKMEQARLFGNARTQIVTGNRNEAAAALRQLGDVEDMIRKNL